jgi:cytochrome c biogenesis protein ResB
VLLLGAATFVEQARGNAYASEHIYHSGWFCVLWGILVVASVAWIVRRRLWQRLPVFLIHVAIIIILGGAATSFLTSKEGQMHIRTGTAENMFYNPKEKQMELLPFALRLNAFNVEYYPGTEAPSDFVSRVSIVQETQKAGEKIISMNHILEHQGYRFYQSSFDSDHQGTILAVNYDPYGTPVTYFGYALLALAMMWTLLARG